MKNIKRIAKQFSWILGSVFLVTVWITVLIATVGLSQHAVPVIELVKDLGFAVFIALAQLIWIGSEKDNKAYVLRSFINFPLLVGGCTLLMLWFEWLPPMGWPIVIYYAGFVVVYALIWVIVWRYHNKKRSAMNQKLKEYQEGK